MRCAKDRRKAPYISRHRMSSSAAVPVQWSERFARRMVQRGSSDLTAILALASSAGDIITFSGGFPAPETFPVDVLSSLASTLMRSDAAVALQYSATEGIPSVREYLRDRVAAVEGRHPDAAELMVTSGGIDCMELLAKSLLDEGDLVLVESPSYLGAITAFQAFDALVEGVPVDGDGMQVDMLEDVLRGGIRPKFIYVIPDHQNPTGVTLSLERRHALIELCRHYGVCVLEDVAYRELSFDGGRLPSLWSLAPELVVQAGTFSKIFFPGVRLGWAVGPALLIEQLAVAKQNSDQCSGAFGQRLLEEYGRGGHFTAALEQARSLYRRRWELLDTALEAHMPDGCHWTHPSGGFFTWLSLPLGCDTSELLDAAMASRVAFVAGRPFYPDARPSSEIRLSFSRVQEAEIDEGVRRLASVIAAAGRG